jgi:phosphohistidine phosphatase
VPTSKTLLLVRHAKSSWEDADLDDIDRPLNKRGVRDAPEMGRRLSGRSLIPDLIVSSPAVRALMTASAIAREVSDTVSVVIEEGLYAAAPQDVLDIVADFDDGFQTALVVGHNPTMTQLANSFSSAPIENVPTCGMLFLEATMWSSAGAARLLDFDYPKKT